MEFCEVLPCGVKEGGGGPPRRQGDFTGRSACSRPAKHWNRNQTLAARNFTGVFNMSAGGLISAASSLRQTWGGGASEAWGVVVEAFDTGEVHMPKFGFVTSRLSGLRSIPGVTLMLKLSNDKDGDGTTMPLHCQPRDLKMRVATSLTK